VPDPQSGLKMVQDGRIDAYSLPVLSLNDLLAKSADDKLEVYAPVVGAPVYCDGAAFNKNDTALRDAFELPGMRVLQFGFDGSPSNPHLPHNHVRRSVAYSGTHDNDTAVGWWHAASERERRYAGTYLACGAHDVHWAMIRAALNSVAHIAIVPLQDVLGLGSEHRMNTPGTEGGANWGWRCNSAFLKPITSLNSWPLNWPLGSTGNAVLLTRL
jgi:hypothetical protein